MLRAAADMVEPEWSEPLRDELKWLAGELGPLRDADVFLEYLRAETSGFQGDDRTGADRLVEPSKRSPRRPCPAIGGAARRALPGDARG